MPLGAGIVAVADAFDDFLSDRPHRWEVAVNAARDQVLLETCVNLDSKSTG